MAKVQANEIRREFSFGGFKRSDCESDPNVQFRIWLNDAIELDHADATAMVLSTITPENKPSSRVVLLKKATDNGLTFFTNYDSQKSLHLSKNPFAALVFYWGELDRQVRIEGKVVKSPQAEAEKYFMSRPEMAKLGAWSSPQSRIIPNREFLKKRLLNNREKFNNSKIPKPENWGGFRLIPHRYEFWQGRENRLHDRFEYVLNKRNWEIHRLAP